ncbi:DUF4843 domain-containing protein [uncultured Butyricimonas sp.]|uniref:DUF4843 domain-containing protein n=1 Tax=uncultured Butyricimonas sp. TaxID=1268785 RepID=UPI0026DC5C63|nr:DUF4843 domain-containing protein [uncultured Butyricimonas sp.]
MKTFIFLIFSFIILWACSEDKTYEYKSVKYLHFSKPEIPDSATVLSFTHYPGVTEKEIAVEVLLAGDLVSRPTPYQLKVDADSTTANAEQYSFDLIQEFPANQIKDTVYIKLFNKELEGKEVTLYIRIVENENFTPGLKANQAARIIFNNISSKPDWWDEEVETLFLGEWSAKKYSEFVSFTKITDLSEYEFTVRRKICLEFKKYLKDEGITEEDGVTPMEIPVN